MLTNVLLIPELIANLISIGCADDNNLRVEFDKGICTFKSREHIVATGKKLDRNLYMMSSAAIRARDQAALLCQGERTLSEWHRTLGHASDKRVEQLIRDKDLGLTIQGRATKPGCSACPGGKGKHSSHPMSDSRKAQRPGDRVFVDLAVSVNEKAISGALYFLVCKDKWSTYTYVYLLRDKSSVSLALAKFIAEFEIDSDYRVKRIHSDNGSEC